MQKTHRWQRRGVVAALNVCLWSATVAAGASPDQEPRAWAAATPIAAGAQSTARPQASGEPQPTAKPQTPGKPQSTAKPQTPGKPQSTGKPQTPAKPQTPVRKPVAAPSEPVLSIQGLVDFGYQAFTAKDSFDAVLGKTGGPVYGGGVRIGHRSGTFAQVTASRFKADGERVFIFNDEVFKLGIPVEVQATPIDVSFGYRYIRRTKTARTPPPQPRPGPPPPPPGAIKPAPPARPPVRATVAPAPAPRQVVFPFVGGGFGRFGYKETADFAEPGDDVDESFTSYHVMGGVEVAVMRWLGVGVEAKYRWVPDALGEDGVSKEFDETDLGGFVIVGRVTIGR